MAWTPPVTALPGDTFTDGLWNTYVRDNMLATERQVVQDDAPLLQPGHIVSIAQNLVDRKEAKTAFIATQQTTTSTSFTNLATVGPTVTADVGDSALIIVQCYLGTNNPDMYAVASFQVTSHAGSSPGDANSVIMGRRTSAPASASACSITYLTGFISSGGPIATVQMKYRVGGSGAAGGATGFFAFRHLTVIGLG